MPIIVRNITLGLDEPEARLPQKIARRLHVPERAIRAYAIVRRSLDARRKDDIRYAYQVELDLDEPPQKQRRRLERFQRKDVAWLEPPPLEEPTPGTNPLPQRPIVVGFGPGGLFAALRLAQHGYRPIVLERGRDIRRRHRDVMHRFYRLHEFDPTSNLLYGEGGAGTYSDGKLYTRINDPLCRYVLESFYQHGADPDVLIDSRPHIGSDRLPTICMRIRRRIEELGGEIRFECRLDDIEREEERIVALSLRGAGAAGEPRLDAGPVILSIGHSARDTIRMLHARGVRIVPKPFQIGVRIEHPQPLINEWQYGCAAEHQRLAPAEYHMVAKKAGGRHGDVFSFCMCPGGMILPTNESAGLIATNGASRANRASPFGNSGLVITIDPADLVAHGQPKPQIGNRKSEIDNLRDDRGAELALAALAYLEQWEQRAFQATGGTYEVPCQRASDYLSGAASSGELFTSYPLGGQWTDARALIPETVDAALRRALPQLEARFPGFAGPEGLITVPETRASAPIRIMRDSETRQAEGIANLYPVGEGAGYAGGIVSAAVDGIRAADAIIRHYAPVK